MANKEVMLSPEGLRKLEAELEYLKSVKRREVAERIKQARAFGDINENSEYEDAKNEQAFIEGRILTLEKMLKNARLVDGQGNDPEVVGIGSTVRLLDLESDDVFAYTIVGTAEADPAVNKISYESPVGRAVLGQRVGGTVEVSVPAGLMKYRILGITQGGNG